MSSRELTGNRPCHYSHWHRQSLPQSSTMIDIDWIYYCPRCKTPFLLKETAIDKGRSKASFVLQSLARLAQVHAVVVLYGLDASGRITRFRVAEVWPNEGNWQLFSPDDWRQWLLNERRLHDADCPARPAGGPSDPWRPMHPVTATTGR